ncbi:SGNH/GDSL hydrolase family protein [Fimbriiglobus ruber]|uniref:GDSL-lilke lipase/acylhydrolase family protein n=1 Tax=Fimbriiglobus ruber TaxID=1908690 RepID=A0A225DX56_9BACT|nr:SGNH/GDSL hydrolase family protein [Fimbriiglobus ruber]OWK43068.1 GDSL-lilke lipase/acylhydrolase family protein [Fimbriiglobus ruber]
MGHVVLLGDSIFDNARYVPDRPPVIEQVRRGLPVGWRATLLAVDGSVTDDVIAQIGQLPDDASHLFVSAGGNDALAGAYLLNEPVDTVGDALALLAEARADFREHYRVMLRAVLAAGKPTAVCTVYDTVPERAGGELAALGLFNEVILREAAAAGVPVIDLRLVCTDPGDYSPLSPIEPSVVGGAKIAGLIADVAARHDFARPRTIVYA